MADNGIQLVDAETGAANQVISGKLALPGGIGVVSDDGKDTIYVADVFAYRTVDGATGEVSEPARMHADGVTLEYPMSATASDDAVILSSWFTGTVQVIDRKTGKTREMMHGFKAPHDAIRLGNGSFLVNELGTKSLVRIQGEHGEVRTVLIGGLEWQRHRDRRQSADWPRGGTRRAAEQHSDRRRCRRVGHDLLLVRYRECDLQGDEEVAAPSSKSNSENVPRPRNVTDVLLFHREKVAAETVR
jgi:hypothetical protein